ncbi:zinc transporter ZIP4 [Larus michahellis]|uniref:zinc transporter ZIP4 n=1 Tax=Larus michahellis TaxID=119627 RepID=UPI003D9AD1F9
MPPLLLLLLLLVAPGASGRDPPDAAAAMAALEALLSSGRGSLSRGAVRALVGIAGGRAQCRHAGPCGTCLSADAVLALAGAGPRLEAPDLPWLGAAVLATLRQPPATCAHGTAGDWAARARALHRAFAGTDTDTNTGNGTDTDTGNGTGTDTNTGNGTDTDTDPGTGTGNVTDPGSGVPALRAVAELLAAVQPNYRSADGQEGCVDAAQVLAAGAAVSPRVGGRPGQRLLAALGALVLRGRCLRPPQPPGCAPHGRQRGIGPPGGQGQGYALALVAGLVLVLCPLLALALLRCPLCHRAQRWLQPLLMGLAAGALSGDALLHLLPQVLGVHSHGGGEQPHGGGAQPHGGGSQLPWPLLGVLGGLYAAFLLDKLLGILLPPPQQGDHAVGQQRDQGDVGLQPGVSSTELVKVEDASSPQSTQELQSNAPQTLSWMMAVAHGVHGLVDGLVLGAAFATSGASGVATALALLCHELPHALGLQAALGPVPPRRALALGAGSALPLLPGLVAGMALGGAGPARDWLGAASAGLLLHLALGGVVPSLLRGGPGGPWALLGLQSAGLLGGWGGLLLLALYEDRVRL